MNNTEEAVEPQPKELTKLEVVRAVTNSPELATRSVVLGEREFAVVDLPYDDYILFLSQLQPLLTGLLGALPGLQNLGLGMLNPAALITYCGKSLPEMARIVCKQTDPDITVEEVKLLGKTPFKLATVVMAQIEQNGIIAEIKDFFVQFAPLLKMTAKKA